MGSPSTQRTRRALVLPALVLVAMCACAAESDLEILAGLRALEGNRVQMVEAARRFDRAQQKLALWDLDMAQDLRRAGDAQLAEEKTQGASERYQQIRRVYEYVLRQYSGEPVATNYYAELLYDQFGETERAVRLWRLAALVEPRLSAPFNNLGIHYCHCGEYGEGLKAYQTALRLEPDNPDYLFNLAQTYLVHRPQMQALLKCDAPALYREAMRLSKRAAQNAPEDFALLRDYALNFFAADGFDVQPNWRDAARAWQRARMHAPNKNERFLSWLNEARAWVLFPDATQAVACLEEALALRPDSPVAQRLLSEVQSELSAP